MKPFVIPNKTTAVGGGQEQGLRQFTIFGMWAINTENYHTVFTIVFTILCGHRNIVTMYCEI